MEIPIISSDELLSTLQIRALLLLLKSASFEEVNHIYQTYNAAAMTIFKHNNSAEKIFQDSERIVLLCELISKLAGVHRKDDFKIPYLNQLVNLFIIPMINCEHVLGLSISQWLYGIIHKYLMSVDITKRALDFMSDSLSCILDKGTEERLKPDLVFHVLSCCELISNSPHTLILDALIDVIHPHLVGWIETYTTYISSIITTLCNLVKPSSDDSSRKLRINKIFSIFVPLFHVIQSMFSGKSFISVSHVLILFFYLCSSFERTQTIFSEVFESLSEWFESLQYYHREGEIVASKGINYWYGLVKQFHMTLSDPKMEEEEEKGEEEKEEEDVRVVVVPDFSDKLRSLHEKMVWCEESILGISEKSALFASQASGLHVKSTKESEEFSFYVDLCAQIVCATSGQKEILFEKYHFMILETFRTKTLPEQITDFRNELLMCCKCLAFWVGSFGPDQTTIFLSKEKMGLLFDKFIDHLLRIEKSLGLAASEWIYHLCTNYSYFNVDERAQVFKKIKDSLFTLLTLDSGENFPGPELFLKILTLLGNLSSILDNSIRDEILDTIQPNILRWFEIYPSSSFVGKWLVILHNITLSEDDWSPCQHRCVSLFPTIEKLSSPIRGVFVNEGIMVIKHLVALVAHFCCVEEYSVKLHASLAIFLDDWYEVFKAEGDEWGIRNWSKLIASFSNIPCLVQFLCPKYDVHMEWCALHGAWPIHHDIYQRNVMQHRLTTSQRELLAARRKTILSMQRLGDDMIRAKFLMKGGRSTKTLGRFEKWKRSVKIHTSKMKVDLGDIESESLKRGLDLKSFLSGRRSITFHKLFFPFSTAQNLKCIHLCVNSLSTQPQCLRISFHLKNGFTMSNIHRIQRVASNSSHSSHSSLVPQLEYEWFVLPVHISDIVSCEMECMCSWKWEKWCHVEALRLVRETKKESERRERHEKKSQFYLSHRGKFQHSNLIDEDGESSTVDISTRIRSTTITSPRVLTPLCILGSGAFGEVLLVKMEGMETPCVLKKMLKIGEKTVLRSCKKEFRAQLRLFMHPQCFSRIPRPLCILNCMNANLEGVFGFMMEYCAGGSVRSFARSWAVVEPTAQGCQDTSESEISHSTVRSFDSLKIASLCVAMIECLDDVFRAQPDSLVHRDIKPENFLVRVDPATSKCTVVLGDLGLLQIQDTVSSILCSKTTMSESHSSSISSEKTLSHFALCGTFVYNSYEALNEGFHSQAGDAYSLGMTILSLFSNESPLYGHPLLRGIEDPSLFIERLITIMERHRMPSITNFPIFTSLKDHPGGRKIHDCLEDIYSGLTEKDIHKRMTTAIARERIQEIKEFLPSVGEGWRCPSIEEVIRQQLLKYEGDSGSVLSEQPPLIPLGSSYSSTYCPSSLSFSSISASTPLRTHSHSVGG
ncbi:hypothetical protein ADUPG1_014226 [Aduncisulcus paluster]|uniref:Protein kinase domain-containing protein n=1 Tax=Aduncisulcus paluster TaxID=2918883 RepID=A0ABQ5KG09_9EUKA|nr:hypothetical protein ADUPG1_014226 [Aduncisulcus paluster]